MRIPYDPTLLPTLPWTDPGLRPYTGSFNDALRHYAGEIPHEHLSALLELVKRPADNGRYVIIDRSGIKSPNEVYKYSDLRMMHFGDGQIVKAVLSTSSWPDDFNTGALIFEVEQYAVCIPTVCRNVSIVTRRTPSISRVDRVAQVSEPPTITMTALAAVAAWFAARRNRRGGS